MFVHIIHKETNLVFDYDKKHTILKPFSNAETQHWYIERTKWRSLIITNKVNGYEKILFKYKVCYKI